MNTDTPETDRAASRDYSPLSVPCDFARNLERQRNNLQQWKDEQLIVESQWDAQAIGKELNLSLGGSIRAGILPAVQQLKAALEREQMRLVACDVIAMCDTPESAADARHMHQDYESAALESVKRRVDECIALRQMVRELRDALNASLIRTYTSGYRHGHEATVEAQYFDIHRSDESSYFNDNIHQMMLDGSLPEATAALAKANQLLP